MPRIHPTTVIEPGAQIADDVVIGPLCYIGPDVVIGAGTQLQSHVAVVGHTAIGRSNVIWPHATLGASPQDLKYKGEDTRLIIGDHNTIRESVTIHPGTVNGGGVTRLGYDNFIMAGAHVAHDCLLGDHIVITNAVQLAGHISIGDHAIIGGASAVHSYVSIGQYAFVGGMTRVTKDVPPFMTVEGNPSQVRGVNAIGLERNCFAPENIHLIKDAYRRLFRNPNGDGGAVGNLADNLAVLETDHGDDECIQSLTRFLRRTMIGLHGRYRESLRHDNRHTNPAR